jgi:hypothetical protein
MEFITVNPSEFVETAKRNPQAIAKFVSYYKYYFYFNVAIENHIWRFGVGGDSSDIYRLSIEPETPLKDFPLDIIDFTEKSLP